MAEIGERVLEGRYVLLRHVHGWTGGPPTVLGKKGICRYCDERDPRAFRKTAHTVPEALGNKWIISADECDACNRMFSLYDDALANSVSPFLTLGGTKGKGNEIRQTGRTAGNAVMMCDGAGLSISSNADPMDQVTLDSISGRLRLSIPVPGVPFRPRHAYKALSKIGLALLPDDEIDNYKQLRAWILDAWDSLEFPVLDAAISFDTIGRPLPAVSVSLFRRINPADEIPNMLLFLCFGSICLQIDLMSDHLEDHFGPIFIGDMDIKYGEFSAPTHLNWSTRDPTPQPIETMILDVNPRTCVGHFTPVFRPGAISGLL